MNNLKLAAILISLFLLGGCGWSNQDELRQKDRELAKARQELNQARQEIELTRSMEAEERLKKALEIEYQNTETVNLEKWRTDVKVKSKPKPQFTWKKKNSVSEPIVKTQKQKEVDKEVDKILRGKHGAMPKAQRLNLVNGKTTKITVKNDTGFTLTVMYSGATSRKIVCNQGDSETFTLNSGDYKVAARVDNPTVIPFAGSQIYKGGSYSSSFYIKRRKF